MTLAVVTAPFYPYCSKQAYQVCTEPAKKLDAIDQFHPARMADRILGMGDIVSLVERAQEQYDEEEAKRLQKKIAKNQFDFNDFLSQIAQIKKMGNLKELASMIPGGRQSYQGYRY